MDGSVMDEFSYHMEDPIIEVDIDLTGSPCILKIGASCSLTKAWAFKALF